MFRTATALVLLATLSLLVYACDGGHGSKTPFFYSPTPAPSSTPIPVAKITQPEPARGYHWASHLSDGARFYVYNKESDTIQAILGAGAPGYNTDPTWLNDDELFVDLDDNYRVNIDGNVSLFTDDMWLTVTPTATPGPARSRLGWTAVQFGSDRPDEGPIVMVRNDAGKLVWIVSNATDPVWAANGSGFAFTGNTCGGWSQMWFDVGSGAIKTVADSGVLSAIAGPALGRETLALLRARPDVWWSVDDLDIDSLQMRELFAVDASGSFYLKAWNPSGTRLLVMHTGSGHSFLCESTPTAVERVGD